MKRPEQKFQIGLVRDLNKILDKSVVMTAIPNGGLRSKVEAAIFKGMGVQAGMPDLMFFWRGNDGVGRAHGLELKAEKGYLSPSQISMHARLRLAGVGVDVVRSLDEALCALRAAGVPIRIKN